MCVLRYCAAVHPNLDCSKGVCILELCLGPWEAYLESPSLQNPEGSEDLSPDREAERYVECDLPAAS